MKSPITTHILDTAIGRPAAKVKVTLEQEGQSGWKEIGSGHTDADGRASQLLPTGATIQAGTYKLTFSLRDYFAAQNRKSFYPLACVIFEVEDPGQHYHVPLLLSGFGFSTYRGS